jgi:uncharacterized protein YbaR (Trm112 family)
MLGLSEFMLMRLPHVMQCQDNGVCPTCRKAFPEHSHLVCTRVTPGMTWPVIGKIPGMLHLSQRIDQLRVISC